MSWNVVGQGFSLADPRSKPKDLLYENGKDFLRLLEGVTISGRTPGRGAASYIANAKSSLPF